MKNISDWKIFTNTGSARIAMPEPPVMKDVPSPTVRASLMVLSILHAHQNTTRKNFICTRTHAIKFQSVVLPNGIIAHMGPWQESDMMLLF